jgi:uncharacterized protein (DUF58 family)
MNAVYVRKYFEEREVTAWFLVDLTPSMDFGGGHGEKRARLIELVTTLARLLTRHGNRVGAILYSNRIEKTIPAGGGRLHVLRLANELMRAPRLARAPQTDLAPLFAAAVQALKRRCLVFAVSDFISQPGWEKPLALLGRRHEAVAVRLWHPREVELPDVGPLVLEDAETGEQLYVDTRDRLFRRRFYEAAQRREAALNQAFKQAGVDALSLSTDEELVQAIVRFAGERRRLRKRA